MYVVTDKGGGIALMIAALLLLGTWPAIFNLLVRSDRCDISEGSTRGESLHNLLLPLGLGAARWCRMRPSRQGLSTAPGAASVLSLTAWPGMTLTVLLTTQERRGRLPIHTFLDYVIFNYLIAIIFALTVRPGPPCACAASAAERTAGVGGHCRAVHLSQRQSTIVHMAPQP
jgi:hypothetical protein